MSPCGGRTFVIQVLDEDGAVRAWLGSADELVRARWRAREIPHLASAEWIAQTSPATSGLTTRVVEVVDVDVDAPVPQAQGPPPG